MNAPAGNRFVARLRDLEARGDAWTARCTGEPSGRPPGFRSGLARLLVAVAFFGFVLLAFWPHLGLVGAFGFAAFGCTYAVVFASAWYGYRKYTRRPPWKVFLVVFLLVLCGAAAGFLLGNLIMQRPLAEIGPERAARALAAAMVMGLVLAGTLMGVARLRLREVTRKAATLQAELKLLQAQVEPHFLFNTLANLRYLVQTGSRDALPMIDNLIQYLRTALPELRAEGSTLGREAELARAYLEIMRLRMGGALEVAIDVPDEVARAPFPPLMLVTLVENAIKHGVAPVGRGRIVVRAGQRDGRLRVAVEDDGRGLAEPIGRGVGLANMRERLRAIYGDGARLDLRAREPSGAVATIELPAR